METWILHIRLETYISESQITVNNKYTAWMTEKQAYKAVAKFLLEATQLSWQGPMLHQFSLQAATRALVECDKIQEAIDLVNEYSVASPYRTHNASSSKIRIIIEKSTFLGSPFD